MILCISVLSVVIFHFSFLILLTWFFSLCFLMSLANGLSILFIFSKKQLLALFIMVSFVSFAFLSALIFKIYFLLLTLGFFISSFSSCFNIEFSYLFDFFLVSWGKPVLLWAFPLTLLLQCPIGFRLFCFHFPLFLCIFWFLFWFLLWFVGYSEPCCSTSICWNF